MPGHRNYEVCTPLHLSPAWDGTKDSVHSHIYKAKSPPMGMGSFVTIVAQTQNRKMTGAQKELFGKSHRVTYTKLRNTMFDS
jgi:hypothetical protein